MPSSRVSGWLPSSRPEFRHTVGVVLELDTILFQLSQGLAKLTASAAETVDPKLAPALVQIGSGSAVYCGERSPLTQLAWLGYKEPVTLKQIIEVEEFYDGRATSWEYVANPFCDPRVVSLVMGRGWTNLQYENVMVLDLNEYEIPVTSREVDVSEVSKAERDAWSELSTRAFFGDEVPDFCANIAPIMSASESTMAFWAILDGQPASTATMSISGEACYLGGAATLPPFRGRGAQGALLAHRLAVAKNAGLKLAVCECLPGSQSQRNQERSGFKVAFTKLVMTRP